MAMPGTHPQPTYTIEQIELIRRLRNSGLTKEQVVQAYEQFERVDAELGDTYNVPVSHMHPMSSVLVSKNSSRTIAAKLAQQAIASVSSHSNFSGVVTSTLATAQLNYSEVSAPIYVKQQSQLGKRPNEQSNGKSEDTEKVQNGPLVQMSVKDVCPKAKAVKLFHCPGEFPNSVEDFLSLGSDKMYAEIRDFFAENPNFTPNDMASAAGVDVTCASKFLVGNFMDLSPDVLQLLSQWLLCARSQCRNQSQKQTDQDPKWDMNGQNPPPVYPEGLDVQFTPRRERFTFRKKHLEILEAVFKTNQYPSYDERVIIAGRCNSIMEAVASRPLGEKERMNPQNVAYWFSNRRKEIKRMAREGGCDTTEVVLPSRVKLSPVPLLLDGCGQFQETAQWGPAGTGPLDSGPMPMQMGLCQNSMGPVVFPTAVRVNPDYTETENSLSGSLPGVENGTGVQIKQEPADFELHQHRESEQSLTSQDGGTAQQTEVEPPSTSQSLGSTVNRIADEISAQLKQASTSSETNIGLASFLKTGAESAQNENTAAGNEVIPVSEPWTVCDIKDEKHDSSLN